MTHITSPGNHRLRSARRLHGRRERDRTGHFMAEGEDIVNAAVRAGRPAVEGYRLAESALGGEGFHDVEPAALKGLSALGSGARVIGIYEQRFSEPVGPLCVYLHGVGDPGNVGAVLRAAEAFGASCVALGPACADPHSPKAVRASMGAIFAVALARVADIGQLPGERIALVPDGGRALRELAHDDRDYEDRKCDHEREREREADAARRGSPPAITLLVGAERDGLPPDIVAACERTARIPIVTQSLNAAMAATVALYELTRAACDRAPSDGRASSEARPSSRVRAS